MAATLEKPASIKPPEKPGSPGTTFGDQQDQKSAVPKKKRNLKLILILGAFGFFVFTFIFVSFFKGRPAIPIATVRPQLLLPTPTMVPRPSITPLPLGEPSVYASDPQILQLEGALKNFERQLESVDFREQEIDPPVLFMSVNFKVK